MAGDPQIKELFDELESIKQAIEINQSYYEGTNTLLGRLIFPNNASIGEIIVKSKTQPEKYLMAYNLCDGNLTVTEIAQKCGLDKSNLNKVLSEWDLLGIIYEINKPGGKYYKNLSFVDYQEKLIDQTGHISKQWTGKRPTNDS